MRGHPLVAGHGQAGAPGALPGHADELLGRDVGGDQRESDQRPDQAAAGQEEVLARAAFAALVHADADDEGEESDEDGDVGPVQVHERLLDRPAKAENIISAGADLATARFRIQ